MINILKYLMENVCRRDGKILQTDVAIIKFQIETRNDQCNVIDAKGAYQLTELGRGKNQ